MGAPMERSASGTGNQRAAAKDGTEKKRSRAPNSNAAAARKKYVSGQFTPKTHSANTASLLPQAECHIQCWIARPGPLTSYRNIQCPTRSCKPRPEHCPATVVTSSAECWSNKQCPPTTVVLDFQPPCSRECFKALRCQVYTPRHIFRQKRSRKWRWKPGLQWRGRCTSSHCGSPTR
jgi:hypothetical protein